MIWPHHNGCVLRGLQFVNSEYREGIVSQLATWPFNFIEMANLSADFDGELITLPLIIPDF